MRCCGFPGIERRGSQVVDGRNPKLSHLFDVSFAYRSFSGSENARRSVSVQGEKRSLIAVRTHKLDPGT